MIKYQSRPPPNFNTGFNKRDDNVTQKRQDLLSLAIIVRQGKARYWM